MRCTFCGHEDSKVLDSRPVEEGRCCLLYTSEILMYLRRNNKTRTEVSFDEPLNIDWDGNELLLSDILGTENDIISRPLEEEVDKKLLNAALQRLNTRERCIMQMRFGLCGKPEKTQKEVAEMLGISQSYICLLYTS